MTGWTIMVGEGEQELVVVRLLVSQPKGPQTIVERPALVKPKTAREFTALPHAIILFHILPCQRTSCSLWLKRDYNVFQQNQ